MRKLVRSVVSALILSTSVAAAAAPSVEPQARLAQLLEGRVAGKPVPCISLRDIRSTEIIEGTAIVYRVGSKLYVNRPRGSGAQLRRDDTLITNAFGQRLCRVDPVQTVHRWSFIPRGFVSLGDFVPYERVAD